MSVGLIIIIVAVAMAGAAVAALPDRSILGSLKISAQQAIRVGPIVIPAVFAAGFIAELLPRAAIAHLIGPESGFTGAMIAAAMGVLLPTGPMVVLPIGAALLAADAGPAQVLALYNAWTIMNVQRLFLWELPMLGPSLTLRRFSTGVVLMPIAALCALAAVKLAG